MKEKLKENFKNKKTIVLLLVGALVFLGTIIGATYAYLGIVSTNSATNTSTTGALSGKGNVTLTTNTSNLYINLDAVDLSLANIGKKYFATDNVSGTPILESDVSLGNGRYTLATASLSEGDTNYNCYYSFTITANTAKLIDDGTEEDIKIIVRGDSIESGSITYTLAQLINGTTLEGAFSGISAGTDKTITIESIVENSADLQNDFNGNSYTISITPQSFECSIEQPNQYEQLVNYTMLYDEGDECTDITGGWSNNGFLDYSFQKNTTSFSLTSVIQGRRYGLITNNIIDLRKYSSSFMVAKRTDTTLEGGLTTWVGSSKSFNHDGVMYNGLSIQGVTKSGWIPIKTTNTLCISTYLYNDALFSTINSGYFGIENYANVSNSNLNLNIIHIGLLQKDNYQELSQKAGITTPADLATLLADASSLATIFNSRDAVNYMARQCTGDFMASAVQSSTFKSALNASEYKDIIENNEHWAKFLAMSV